MLYLISYSYKNNTIDSEMLRFMYCIWESISRGKSYFSCWFQGSGFFFFWTWQNSTAANLLVWRQQSIIFSATRFLTFQGTYFHKMLPTKITCVPNNVFKLSINLLLTQIKSYFGPSNHNELIILYQFYVQRHSSTHSVAICQSQMSLCDFFTLSCFIQNCTGVL